MISSIFFSIFSIILILSTLFSLACKNMIYSILWAMISFLMVAGFYVLLNANYNTAVQLIIYVAVIPILLAISIMFVANEKPKKEKIKPSKIFSFIGIIFFTLIIVKYYSLNTDFFQIAHICQGYHNTYSSLISIAKNILGMYPILFIQLLISLYIAIIGVTHYEN